METIFDFIVCYREQWERNYIVSTCYGIDAVFGSQPGGRGRIIAASGVVCVIRTSMTTTSESPPAPGDDRSDDGEWADWYVLSPLERLEEENEKSCVPF
jgi:hypothetical protein